MFETGAVRHNASIGIDHQDARTDNDSFYGAGTPLNLYDPVYGTPQTAGPLADAPSPTSFRPVSISPTGSRSGTSSFPSVAVSTGWNSTEGVAAVQEDEAFTTDAGILYKVGNGLAPYFNFAESFLPASGFEVDANGNVLDPGAASSSRRG